jgi:2-aminobenzoate-CoA ligase
VSDAVAATDVENAIVFGAAPIAGLRSWSDLLADAASEYSAPPPPADPPAVLWHTGGTTGTPKGCYHTQRRFLLGGIAAGLVTGAGRGERWAAAAPIGHALGFLHYTTYTLLHGATAVLIEDFHQPEALLRAIRERRVDTFTAISASWAGMLDAMRAGAEPVTSVAPLRRAYAMWQSASSSDVYDWWKAHGVDLMNNFGSTAFATWVLAPRAGDVLPAASLGRPAPGYRAAAIEPDGDPPVEVPVGSPGRLAVKGPTGLTYWNRPVDQRRDVVGGWTLVDDLIRFDTDGNAAYLGRTDFLISTAGYKVASAEVEEVIARHPGV